MKHKRIHAKITEHLEQNGDATTGQIHDWVTKLKPTRKNRAKGAGFMTGQSLNVLSNVLRRKPIVKVGFDNEANQAIWGIRDSE
jgi:hypothetical protein